MQAFVIALYAEMYGFPLTIYLLARGTARDRSIDSRRRALRAGQRGAVNVAVCEYPVLEGARRSYRTVTDLDVLAVRFPGAGRLVGRSIDAGRDVDDRFEPDAVLDQPRYSAGVRPYLLRRR